MSAVDQHVGRFIFEECFTKHLAQQTVIIAMHQLQYLPQMDWVVVIKDGLISMQGTYADLMEKELEFSTLMNHHVAEIEDEDDDSEVINEDDFDVDSDVHHNSHNTFPQNNENVVKQMIERNQLTVTRGLNMAELIRQNENSVFSTHEFVRTDLKQPIDLTETKTEKDADIAKIGKLVSADASTSSSSMTDMKAYFKSATGAWITSSVCIYFFLVHGIRIGSGK